MAAVDEQKIKQAMLKVIEELAATSSSNLQSNPVFRRVIESLAIGNMDDEMQQAILTVWQDLFRSGIISWGLNLQNPNPPFFHLTRRGKAAIAQASRDPSNPAGYLAHLNAIGPVNNIAMSYLTEGLATYNGNNFRAAAVMVGCAAESLVLELRDVVVGQLRAKGQVPSNKLLDWRIKTVLDQIGEELDQRLASMPRELREEYSAYWAAFTGQIRMARNDAGHPTSIDPVTEDTVHAGLLVFPQLVKLANQLIGWAKTAI